MKTVLDEAETWFLEKLVYVDELEVVVVEGVRSKVAQDIQIGDYVLKDSFALEPVAGSRRVLVRFPRTVAWQVVDESYTAGDESEVRDGTGFLVALIRSSYMTYVQAHHGWFKDMVGPGAHYCLWTENEVIDVVAHEAPVVQSLEPMQLRT